MLDAVVAVLILIIFAALAIMMLVTLAMMAREINALGNDMEAIERDMRELTHPGTEEDE